MQERSGPFATTAVCLTAVAVWSLATVPVAVAQLDMVLIHANDMHSHFDESDTYGNECSEIDAAAGRCYGGFARVAQFVRDEKREAQDRGVPALFMVAGDTFQGTPYFSLFGWKPVADSINHLQPDVMTLGNHEFDDGVDNLLLYLNETKSIPTVISNFNYTTEPRFNELLLSSYIFTLNNTKVGVVGYLTTDIRSLSNTGDVEFFDEIESLKKETKKLRDNGVDIIIGLGHSGIVKDQEIAKEVEDIDLIVGGHSHTFLYSSKPPSFEKPYGPYPFYVKNHKNKTVPILHAYKYTKYIGKVDLKFDSNGNLVSINGSPTLLNHEIQQDPAMMIVIDQWKPKVTNMTSVTIGRTAVKLLNNDCIRNECNIGNLIADSFVYYNVLKRNVFDPYWTDAPIGIIQFGGIRTSIIGKDRDGQINMGQLISVAPFSNSLIKTTISGSSLLEAFEHSVSSYKMDASQFNLLQVSGVLVEFDLTQSPGHRVSSLYLRCGRCRVPKFEPLELTANYTVLISNFLANGGDNFKSFTKKVKKNELLDTNYRNAIITYIQSISPITTGIEGRISFKNSNSIKSNESSIKSNSISII